MSGAPRAGRQGGAAPHYPLPPPRTGSAQSSQGAPHAAHRPEGSRSDSRPQTGHTWSTQQAGSPPSGSGRRGSSGGTAAGGTAAGGTAAGQPSSSGGANRASASTGGQV